MALEFVKGSAKQIWSRGSTLNNSTAARKHKQGIWTSSSNPLQEGLGQQKHPIIEVWMPGECYDTSVSFPACSVSLTYCISNSYHCSAKGTTWSVDFCVSDILVMDQQKTWHDRMKMKTKELCAQSLNGHLGVSNVSHLLSYSCA